jgi:hypothetical protein
MEMTLNERMRVADLVGDVLQGDKWKSGAIR